MSIDSQTDKDLVRKMERVYGVHHSTSMQITSVEVIFVQQNEKDSFALYTRLSTIVFFTFFAIAYEYLPTYSTS